MGKKLFLGIDVGSITIKTAVLDGDAHLLSEAYLRIKGDPLKTLLSQLQALSAQFPDSSITAAGITGSGGKQVAATIGALFINEILAHSAFVKRFHPAVRTIIELGGEDAKLITLAGDRAAGVVKIEDFSMNAACAAGTGSFLDQQANRMHLTIEEFSELALKSKTPPRVAGRCSVFAKSDMIHLQQIATPDYDIVAGLCYALARNFKSNIGRGKNFTRPIAFQGGVAANVGMRRAFMDVLEVSDGELIIPKYFASMGAIGAILVTQETSAAKKEPLGLGRLHQYL